MRWSIIRTILGKELREMLRDRRSMMVMFGIPLVLYPLLTLAVAGVGSNKAKELQERPVRVMIENPDGAPELVQRLSDPKKFQIVSQDTLKDGITDSLGSGKVDAVLTIPPTAEKEALTGGKITIAITIDRSKTFADYSERRLQQTLNDYQRWLIEQRLAKRDVPADVLTGVDTSIHDVARAEQRFGKLLSMMIPMLLLVTGTLGALFPALNATTMEKENGTLEALLVTPASRLEILLAKGILVFSTGLLTAALNMASMSAVLWRVTSLATEMDGKAGGLFTIDPGALVLSFFAAVPALIFFTSLVLIVGLIARNYREANSFVTPVMLLPMASIFVSIAEPTATPALMLTPVVSTTVIMRDILVGHINWGFFFIAFASSCAYAGLMLSLATRIFSTEQLVNPGWEPVSLRGLRGSLGKPAHRWPTIDESIALFAIMLVLQLYVGPTFMGHLPALVAIFAVQIILVTAPPLVLAWIGRYNWVEVFKLRMPDPLTVAGSALLGGGLVFIIEYLSAVQTTFWKDTSGSGQMQAEILYPLLQQFPLITALGMGFLAGVGEEIGFRGVMQTSLTRRMPAWIGIVVASILFAAAHMHLHGMPLRFGLGLLLGWLFWTNRSIIPAIVLHWAYDSTALGYTAWYLHRHGLAAATQESAVSLAFTPKLAIALIIAAVGAAMIFIQLRKKDETSPL